MSHKHGHTNGPGLTRRGGPTGGQAPSCLGLTQAYPMLARGGSSVAGEAS
jgi:hypothetical protein